MIEVTWSRSNFDWKKKQIKYSNFLHPCCTAVLRIIYTTHKSQKSLRLIRVTIYLSSQGYRAVKTAKKRRVQLTSMLFKEFRHCSFHE